MLASMLAQSTASFEANANMDCDEALVSCQTRLTEFLTARILFSLSFAMMESGGGAEVDPEVNQTTALIQSRVAGGRRLLRTFTYKVDDKRVTLTRRFPYKHFDVVSASGGVPELR